MTEQGWLLWFVIITIYYLFYYYHQNLLTKPTARSLFLCRGGHRSFPAAGATNVYRNGGDGYNSLQIKKAFANKVILSANADVSKNTDVLKPQTKTSYSRIPAFLVSIFQNFSHRLINHGTCAKSGNCKRSCAKLFCAANCVLKLFLKLTELSQGKVDDMLARQFETSSYSQFWFFHQRRIVALVLYLVASADENRSR